MYSVPVVSQRYAANLAFERAHSQALKIALKNFLLRKTRRLQDLPNDIARGQASGHNGMKYLGTIPLPIDRITGSAGRTGEFDTEFRPLKKYLQAAWTLVALTVDLDDWSPIRVIRVGNDVFVQDGHLRVSVARAYGKQYLDAEVWESSSPDQPLLGSPRLALKFHSRAPRPACCSCEPNV